MSELNAKAEEDNASARILLEYDGPAATVVKSNTVSQEDFKVMDPRRIRRI